jgi:ketosteroid isomerase-like protein
MRRIACCLLLAVLSAPSFAAEPADAERAIRAALAHWVEAANRGDFAQALSVWAPDLIGWAPGGPDDTYAGEREAAQQPAGPPKATYALKIDEVIVDRTMAVVRDTWTETVHADGGDKVSTFRSFEVWREQPDKSWKISRWIDGPPQARR